MLQGGDHTAQFVQVGDDLINILTAAGFAIVDEPRANEIVMDRHITEMLHVRIYTTVEKDSDEGRDVGEDAIRVILYADNLEEDRRGLGKTTRVHRTTSVESILTRIMDRVADVEQRATVLMETQPGWLFRPQPREVVEPKPVAKPTINVGPAMRFPSNGGSDAPEPDREATKDLQQGVMVAASPSVFHDPTPAPALPVPEWKQQLREWKLQLPFDLNPFQLNAWQSGAIYYGQDCVISAPTSAGKTALAMMAAARACHDWNITILTTPLKALTEQHAADLRLAMPDEQILVMTGDYQLSEKTKKELNSGKYSIICMTSEMLGSRCTKASGEGSTFLSQVQTLIVDEAHLISSEGRGDKLEVALMQFAEVCPKANILCLSATLGSLQDYATWLQRITGRPCRVIETDWRPVKLDVDYVPYADGGRPWMFEPRAYAAIDILQQYPDDKFLVFCPAKADSRKLCAMLQKMGDRAEWHNAARPKDELRDIEKRFKDPQGDVRVVCATTTLAYGLNLPARRVIIMGTFRGMKPIDSMDVVQMQGRAGRLGLDEKGDAHVLVPVSKYEEEVQRLSKIGIRSVLSQRRDLQFHIVCEIYRGRIQTREQAREWWNRTFAYALFKEQWAERDAERLLKHTFEYLLKTGFIEEVRGIFKSTKLGGVAAQMFAYPDDVITWKYKFDKLIKRGKWGEDALVAMALVHPSLVLSADYVSRAEEDDVSAYMEEYSGTVEEFFGDEVEDVWGARTEEAGFSESEFKFARYIHACLIGKGEYEETYQIKAQTSRWLEVLKFMTWTLNWSKSIGDEWDMLQIRILEGVPREHAALVKIEGVAKVRAAQLFALRITNAQEVVENADLVHHAFGKVGEKIVASAKDILEGGTGKFGRMSKQVGFRPPGL